MRHAESAQPVVADAPAQAMPGFFATLASMEVVRIVNRSQPWYEAGIQKHPTR